MPAPCPSVSSTAGTGWQSLRPLKPSPCGGRRRPQRADRHNSSVLLHHKLGVRLAATAAAAIYAALLLLEPSARNLVLLAGAALLPISAWRGQVRVDDGVVRHRGLFGWGRSSVALPRLTRVSLRRQLSGRHYPLTLKIEDSTGARLNLEVWAWTGWRNLAHLIAHWADAARAFTDEESWERLECRNPSCPGLAPTESAKAQAATFTAPRRSDRSPIQKVGQVALTAPAGFAFGFVGAWLRDDPAGGALWSVGLACAVVFVVIALIAVLVDDRLR